jgi:hypothetical protein
MLDYIALMIALIISSVSAYYSISGLTAIFAAARWPIVIMSVSLELGKVITTLWLRKNWKTLGWAMKCYLTASVLTLMLLTSMGIFGFLSKAHLDQTVPSADIQSEVALLDERIQTERDNIAANRALLNQLDNAVTEVMSRSHDQQGAERSVQIRRSQAAERNKLQQENAAAQQRIQALQNQRAPKAAQVRKVEAEVGPIRYIAALIYGDKPSWDLLERAVRWVITVLVLVFDPLALALMLAVNRKLELKARQHPDYSNSGPAPASEPSPEPAPVPDSSATIVDVVEPAPTDINVTESEPRPHQEAAQEGNLGPTQTSWGQRIKHLLRVL